MSSLDTGLSIYLHIPFCSVKCSYCAFNTYTDLGHLIPSYVDALCRELAFAARHCANKSVHTIYFGGGTPSLLNPSQFEQVLLQLARHFRIIDDVETSLEANPDDLNEAYLRDLRRLGFNRLSIGMQSANAAILQMFDRRHDLRAVAAAVDHARRADFDNINLDVIFGSPGETLADWKGTVEAMLRFSPDHVSMYGLELKGGTRLRELVDAGDLPQPDDDLFAEMYELAATTLQAAGYVQYEISNWCLPGNECRHNLQYWRNLEYLGVGAGAHGFSGGYRYSTIASPQRYIAALQDRSACVTPHVPTPAAAKTALVSEADDLYDTIMMGLRLTKQGINRARFRQRFGRDILELFPEPAERMSAAGLLDVTTESIRLSQEGRLLSNGVIRAFVDEITL